MFYEKAVGAGLVVVSVLGLFRLYQGACVDIESKAQVCLISSMLEITLQGFRK